jgi:hypothetical protein
MGVVGGRCCLDLCDRWELSVFFRPTVIRELELEDVTWRSLILSFASLSFFDLMGMEVGE